MKSAGGFIIGLVVVTGIGMLAGEAQRRQEPPPPQPVPPPVVQPGTAPTIPPAYFLVETTAPDGTLCTATFPDGSQATLPVTGGKVYFPRVNGAIGVSLRFAGDGKSTAYLFQQVTVATPVTNTGGPRR